MYIHDYYTKGGKNLINIINPIDFIRMWEDKDDVQK